MGGGQGGRDTVWHEQNLHNVFHKFVVTFYGFHFCQELHCHPHQKVKKNKQLKEMRRDRVRELFKKDTHQDS